MQARAIVRPLLALTFLAATALGLNNSMGDNTEVKALAEKTACGNAPCVVKTLSEQRSAFKQRFGYQTALVEKGKSTHGATIDIECARTFVLLGEYQCHVSSGGVPQVH